MHGAEMSLTVGPAPTNFRAPLATSTAMPQTSPFHFLVPDRKLSDQELARAIRLDLEAELDAINLYAAHLEATDNEEAKAILRYVMDEEKEHASLFTELIHRLDPQQAGHAREASRKFQQIVSGLTHEELEAAETPAPAAALSGLTVGALFRR